MTENDLAKKTMLENFKLKYLRWKNEDEVLPALRCPFKSKFALSNVSSLTSPDGVDSFITDVSELENHTWGRFELIFHGQSGSMKAHIKSRVSALDVAFLENSGGF